ncbi:hypothetical protein NQ315_006406 [Exocentrus adspersus]|uniref:Sensory neuron membrane protein 2 n=1 Tax=Exocentrus adspersus TaxID=1586481 RepID=A0AAV8VZM8_9CUCU|nr:hypothetical protein NQ315_006406 [Exocentrus adspersus]
MYQSVCSYKGVDGLRFTIDENTFRPATQYPENDCFCTQQTLDVDGSPSCYLDGVVDLKTCIGAPILLSFPHFLFADEKYRKAVDGITEPDESIHKIFLLVEPNTGTPLEGRKRAQFNMALRPASYMTLTENLPRAVLPLLWVEEGVSLPDKYIDEINSKYFNALKVANGVKYGIIAVTLAAVVTSTGFLVRKKFFTAK